VGPCVCTAGRSGCRLWSERAPTAPHGALPLLILVEAASSGRSARFSPAAEGQHGGGGGRDCGWSLEAAGGSSLFSLAAEGRQGWCGWSLEGSGRRLAGVVRFEQGGRSRGEDEDPVLFGRSRKKIN
jgi:hypothetical protein